MAGALLAKEGYAVTVLEKATSVGGSAGSYARKNRRYPTGATIAFGLEPNGLLTSHFQELGVSIPHHLLTHPMDVVLEDRSISIYQEQDAWLTELARAFPERSDDVLAFWRTLEQISHGVFDITQTDVSLPIQRFYDVGKLPKYMVTHPRQLVRLARHAFQTVDDLLRA